MRESHSRFVVLQWVIKLTDHQDEAVRISAANLLLDIIRVGEVYYLLWTCLRSSSETASFKLIISFVKGSSHVSSVHPELLCVGAQASLLCGRALTSRES